MLTGSFVHLSALCLALACLVPTSARANDQGRIAIIDASVDTRPFLDELEAAGVKVIGRYLSRCPQGGDLAHKRLIDNKADPNKPEDKNEIDAILAHRAKFGVLSIYQYNSSSPDKFNGRSRFKVPVAPAAREEQNWLRCDEPERGTTLSASQEGDLDGDAAIAQALKMGQPKGSTIYFGVDLNFTDSL